MIVMKFGGSSLESAGAIQQAAAIVERNLDRSPVVVVSAMGKTTDGLLQAAECAARGDSYSAFQRTEALRRMHCNETRALLGQRAEPFLRDSIIPLFRDLELLLVDLREGRRFTPEIQDQALSFGERISSLIVAEAFSHLGINAAQVDARKLIVTDNQFTHASPFYWDTYARLRRTVALVAKDRVVVMGGFIGATQEGATTTLGRGGSDLTATLVGAGISAEEIQIWTDVDGMLTCDPRVLAGGWRMREISYEEANEMARRGAKVLCPAATAPAMRQKIPIVIRNSHRPECEGTRIVARAASGPGIVKCITPITGLALVRMRVRKPGSLSSITDGLADLFDREHVAVELIQTEPQGIVFGVRNWPGLAATLKKVDESVEIAVEENCAAVWLVGQGIGQPEILERAQRALNGIPTRLTSRGSSSVSIGFGIPETTLRPAMEKLHGEFFSTPDDVVFATPEFAAMSRPAPSGAATPPSTLRLNPVRRYV